MILVKDRKTGEVLGEFAGMKSSPVDDYGESRGTLVRVQDIAGRWIPFLIPLTDVYLGG
jgi:hypothetical protein